MNKTWIMRVGGCAVVVLGAAACSANDSQESLAKAESAFAVPGEELALEGECDGGIEIVIPYVDPDIDYAESPDAGGALEEEASEESYPDAGMMPPAEEPAPPDADAGIEIVEAPFNPAPSDGGIQPADRPRPPPKPPVCKPTTVNCNTDASALKPECRGGVKDALYKKQKEICGTERSCKATDTPETLATKLKRNEHCKNLRVQVRDCYVAKCQAGHVIAITEAIAAMTNCQLLISQKN